VIQVSSADALHHKLAGEMTFADAKTALGLLDGALAEVQAANADSTVTRTVEVSLAGITQSNSVLVSLMLVWMRRARRAGVGILFVEIPPLVSSLIEFTGLDEVLPMVNAESST
jgi:ABC-type transporter Mla MlaB component